MTVPGPTSTEWIQRQGGSTKAPKAPAEMIRSAVFPDPDTIHITTHCISPTITIAHLLNSSTSFFPFLDAELSL